MPVTTPRRHVAGTRRSIPVRRKAAPPPRSRGGRLVGLATKALPPAVATKKKATPKKGGKGRTLALLGIAGGLAAAVKKQRSSSKSEPAQPPVPPAPPAPPVQPVA